MIIGVELKGKTLPYIHETADRIFDWQEYLVVYDEDGTVTKYKQDEIVMYWSARDKPCQN